MAETIYTTGSRGEASLYKGAGSQGKHPAELYQMPQSSQMYRGMDMGGLGGGGMGPGGFGPQNQLYAQAMLLMMQAMYLMAMAGQGMSMGGAYGGTGRDLSSGPSGRQRPVYLIKGGMTEKLK